jgi:hypothetical protein
MLLPNLLFDERPPARPSLADARPAGTALAALVDGFLENAYARLEDDRFIRTLHLLIAEGPRVPEVIEDWRADHLRLLQGQQAMIRRAVEGGVLRDSALTDMVQLIHAPILLAAVLMMLQDDEHVRGVVPRLRAAHRRLLLELLPSGSA